MQQSNWRGSARDGAGAIDAGRSGQGGFVRRPLAGQSVEHGPELASSGFAQLPHILDFILHVIE
jgi:hypothetical protein